MKIVITKLTLCLTLASFAPRAFSHFVNQEAELIKGADLSALNKIETAGGVYKENGIEKDALNIFRNHGLNFVRLRIWHTPTDGHNGLEETLSMAQRIKEAGFGFLLDFHYSDTWADPAQQTKPSAWASLSFDALKDSVYAYTRHVISILNLQNTPPDIVQIGNEITCGLLWDDGRVCDDFDTPQQWQQFSELIKEGIRGAKEASPASDSSRIMIHIDRGGDQAGSIWFFDNLVNQNVDFDLIGLSFYPWWHGELDDLRENLDALTERYGKEIVIVETAYPWTLDWADNTHNLVGLESQLHTGYPASVEGQKSFLVDLLSIVGEVKNGKGRGAFYWAPEYIAVPAIGSPWENLALFDFSGILLNSIDAFDENTTGVKQFPELAFSFTLHQNYPNPFNPTTTILYELQSEAYVTLRIHNLIGREIITLVNENQTKGERSVVWNGTRSNGHKVSSAIYIVRLQTNNDVRTRKMILLK